MESRGRARALSEDEIRGYVMGAFGRIKQRGQISGLVEFHAMNKYMLMARDQEGLRRMGRLVAGYRRGSLGGMLQEYGTLLESAMSSEPTPASHYNVMQHMVGHFSRYLSKRDRSQLHALLGGFRRGDAPIGAVLSEIGPLVSRFNSTYLAQQTYFLLYADPGRPGALRVPEGA